MSDVITTFTGDASGVLDALASFDEAVLSLLDSIDGLAARLADLDTTSGAFDAIAIGAAAETSSAQGAADSMASVGAAASESADQAGGLGGAKVTGAGISVAPSPIR